MIPTRTLVFDVETTGKLKFELAADDPAQPRIVEIAAAMLAHEEDGSFAIEDAFCELIKPTWGTMPPDVIEIHGITDQMCIESGRELSDVMGYFKALFDQADAIACYGIVHDTKLIRGEFRRLGWPDGFGTKREFCVMRGVMRTFKDEIAAQLMVSGKHSSKTPKLEEAVCAVLKTVPGRLHRARVDMDWTIQLLGKIIERGAYDPQVRPSK